MYLQIDHRKIHYKKIGSGPALLMIHGWGGSMYSLLPLAQLAASHYCVYLVDLPGFGKSDLPPPHWGIEGYAGLISDFIAAFQLRECAYFGHSFGGEIGIFLASQKHPLIGRLYLCSSSYKRQKPISPFAKLYKMLPFYKALDNVSIVKQAKRLFFALFLRKSDISKYPQLHRNLKKIFTEDLTRCLPLIKIPTTIIWGEDDSITPVIWAHELAHHIPHAKLCLHPDSGHNIPLKHPQVVWDDITSSSSV